ncbi:MAG: sigma-70 family RNA polymerase sigma factor [Clostridia bacterium]|nr:sigma-70 family RNA polymerase sigma factor [Clostridia bacterium]
MMVLNEKQKRDIEQLYYEMYYPLSAYAQSALSDRSLAEEAVQDAFRIACTKADELISSPNPKGWLTLTLKNVIKNMIRSRARLNRIVVASLDVEKNALGTMTDETNIDFLYSNLIGREDYELLKNIILKKKSMLEAALELGISVEACKKRVQRAKKKLKELLIDK